MRRARRIHRCVDPISPLRRARRSRLLDMPATVVGGAAGGPGIDRTRLLDTNGNLLVSRPVTTSRSPPILLRRSHRTMNAMIDVQPAESANKLQIDSFGLARALTIAGLVTVVLASFGPWLRSGQRSRTSYELFEVADRLDLFGNGTLRWAPRIWVCVPVLAAISIALFVGGIPKVGCRCRRRRRRILPARGLGAAGRAARRRVGQPNRCRRRYRRRHRRNRGDRHRTTQ